MGPGDRLTSPHLLRFVATFPGFERAAIALRQILDRQALAENVRYNVELVFDEVAANIVRHGRPRSEVELSLSFDGDVVMTFEDDGVPFDPRDRDAPPVPQSLDEAEIGGLGLVLVKGICREIEYERTPQQRNRLTLVIPR